MDSAMLMNISDQQIDDALNDESGERVGKLNKAIKKLDAEERALISLFYNEEKTIGEIALPRWLPVRAEFLSDTLESLYFEL